MKPRLKFAVMGSTRGTSFLPILKGMRSGSYECELSLVLSNKKLSGILEKARSGGIEALWVPVQGRDREAYDRAVSGELERRGVDFVLLIGYMRILSPFFVEQWAGKIVNVHPSLLPKYSGMMDMSVHQSVIDNQDLETGCSVHLVTEEVDGGPVIIQKKCQVKPNDTAACVKERVQALEGEAFVELLKTPLTYLPELQ